MLKGKKFDAFALFQPYRSKKQALIAINNHLENWRRS